MTSEQVDFFDVLPVHPQPQPFQSLTGYLMQLAEENHITSIAHLTAICFPGQDPKTTRSLADNPPITLGTLSTVSNCSESRLLATTFYPVGRLFGRSTQPQALSRFLNGCVSPHLRYCPSCLAESRYYRLTWRFVSYIHCPTHGCTLLEQCGHCEQRIPILAQNLKVGVCPNCGEPLETCQADRVAGTELEAALRTERDIEAIFGTAPPVGDGDDVLFSLGNRIWSARSSRQISIDMLALRTGISTKRLRLLERGTSRSKVSVSDFLRICAALDVPLADLIAGPVYPRRRFRGAVIN